MTELSNTDLERIISRNRRRVNLCQAEALKWRRVSDEVGERMRKAQAELLRRKGWLPPIDD
jgi:hypothetical protein